MKTCANPKCNKKFPIIIKIGTKFHNLNSRKFCLECSPFKGHNTRDINKPRRLTTYPSKGNYADVKKFRLNKKRKCVDFLGGKCEICGYNKYFQVLEFHHKDPTQKDFGISTKGAWGFERVKVELLKCALLCANCHRELHLGFTKLSENLVLPEGVAPT